MKPPNASSTRQAPRAKSQSISVSQTSSSTLAEKLFALLCGIWLGLSFLKFGNPIIFEQMIAAPKDWAEFVFTPWPIAWGYVLLAAVVLAAIPRLRLRFTRDHSPIALLGIWLLWVVFSNARSIEPRLSNPTLIHLITCGISFLVGWWALGRYRASAWLWTPILACFLWCLFSGFDQHSGGLEATRKAFYEQRNWQLYPKEYLLKIESNRIFSTLVYPNAFAGLILLLLPAATWQSWTLTERWPRVLRGVFVGLLAYLSLACLYWTGSKGGWLIALIAAGVLGLQARIPRKVKIAVISAGLVLGLVAFFVRFSSYFEKGATSVGARFTYWKAAAEITKRNPILGTGPGTFSVLFKDLKPEGAEMAKLVHNDYLEQFCDSGIVAGLSFFAAIVANLTFLYRRRNKKSLFELLLWLGLLAASLQATIEFGLYIPGIAWPSFLFFGLLWAAADEAQTARTHDTQP